MEKSFGQVSTVFLVPTAPSVNTIFRSAKLLPWSIPRLDRTRNVASVRCQVMLEQSRLEVLPPVVFGSVMKASKKILSTPPVRSAQIASRAFSMPVDMAKKHTLYPTIQSPTMVQHAILNVKHETFISQEYGVSIPPSVRVFRNRLTRAMITRLVAKS